MVSVVGYIVVGSGALIILGLSALLIKAKRQLRVSERLHGVAKRQVNLRAKLASQVAHDIKNPLTAILCSAEALDLLIGDTLDNAHRTSLRYIREHGRILLRVLGQFLDLQRAEGHELKLRATPSNFKAQVEAVWPAVEECALRRSILTELRLAESEVEVCVEAKSLRHVLEVLLHSAVQCGVPGSQVMLSSATGASPQAEYAVELTFVGAKGSAAEVSTLFDPYAQIDGGARAVSIESVIGFSLAKAMIEQLSGTLEARGEVGERISLLWHVPVKAAALKTTAVVEHDWQIPADLRPLAGQALLIVHDDIGARESVCRLVVALGGVADQVGEAADAVEALARRSYTAVMIDEDMSDIDARELARIIKDDLNDRATVILATDPGAETPLPTQHIDRYIEKPLDGTALLKTLRP